METISAYDHMGFMKSGGLYLVFTKNHHISKIWFLYRFDRFFAVYSDNLY